MPKLTRAFCERATVKIGTKRTIYWDTGTVGLGLRVTANGHRSFVVQYRAGPRGRAGIDRRLTIGSGIALDVARREAKKILGQVAAGADPLKERRAAAAQAAEANANLFESIVDHFIKEYAQPRQRRWDDVERILKRNCKVWLKRPINDITKQDARKLLRGFVADGHPYKAMVTYRWLKKLWRWAYREDLVAQPIMEAVGLDIEKRKRDRVFSDDEIKATWAAASKLEVEEASFVKLLMLLAPRKTSLACVTRADLNNIENPTLWTVPFELTKSRKTSAHDRIYPIPLPPLCQRLFKSVMKDGELFPSLPVYKTKAGQRVLHGNDLKLRLVEFGAPPDFHFHAWRHTVATFLKNAGHSRWERALVLNHAESGVTADYSHGYPIELKLKLLTKWVDHVASLICCAEPRINVIELPDRQAATAQSLNNPARTSGPELARA
jgi:integrase